MNICIIGLGYVGLPLAVELSKHYKVIGFDIDQEKISKLNQGLDLTGELDESELNQLNNITITDDILESDIIIDFYIVTVPTPIDIDNKPNLEPLKSASRLIAKKLKKGDMIVYESTVYPGVTEEECLPILESISSLKVNVDFGIGYSPERINPADKARKISQIVKVVSASNEHYLDSVKNVYSKIIHAGLHEAPSIRVAEAAKVIENAQRDTNIAFMNEIAMIFDKLDINIYDVLEAASTKWNFLNFYPGLVGGHCISVDPYYLTHKSEEAGFIPDMLLTARRINEGMTDFIIEKTIKGLINNEKNVKHSKIAILGLTFKENCPDARNSKSIEIYKKLRTYSSNLVLVDPYIDTFDGVQVYNELPEERYDAILILVSHNEFNNLNLASLKEKYFKSGCFIIDIKNFLKTNRILIH